MSELPNLFEIEQLILDRLKDIFLKNNIPIKTYLIEDIVNLPEGGQEPTPAAHVFVSNINPIDTKPFISLFKVEVDIQIVTRHVTRGAEARKQAGMYYPLILKSLVKHRFKDSIFSELLLKENTPSKPVHNVKFKLCYLPVHLITQATVSFPNPDAGKYL